MGLYVISCIDRPGAIDLRLATRAQHLAFLAAASCVKVAGPYFDNEGQMAGSMLVVDVASMDEAAAFAAADPYARAGLFRSSDIRAWKQTAGSSAIIEPGQSAAAG